MLDILLFLFWFLILYGILKSTLSKDLTDQNIKLFNLNLFIKTISCGIFAFIHIKIYNGGDTLAYFQTAKVLNILMMDDFGSYLNQLFFDYENGYQESFFITSFPPRWIFNEKAGFFLSKLFSPIAFLSNNNYLIMSLFTVFFSTFCSWKFYIFLLKKDILKRKHLIINSLFIPSINFWCVGIGKDTIMFNLTLLLIIWFFELNNKKKLIRRLILIIISSYIIYNIRGFMLAAILLPLIISLLNEKFTNYIKSFLLRLSFMSLLFMTILISITSVIDSDSPLTIMESSTYMEEALKIRKDFSKNISYGSNKLEQTSIEFTSFGLLLAFPSVTFDGIFRPLIWESFSLTLFMNGIESGILLYFVFTFIITNGRKKIKLLLANNLLTFCLLFVITIGFVSGLTSVLYGVLVRVRAPLLPFLFLILTMDVKKVEKYIVLKNKSKSSA